MKNMRKMKRLEEMSREELIKEAIYLSKRIDEEEAAHKENERQIAELKKHMQSRTAEPICQSLNHSCRSFLKSRMKV